MAPRKSPGSIGWGAVPGCRQREEEGVTWRWQLAGGGEKALWLLVSEPRQLPTGEREYPPWGLLLCTLSRLGGGDLERCGEGEALDRHRLLGDCPSLHSTGGPPLELLILERPPALFDLVLGRARNTSRSTEGLSCRSAMEPMSVRIAGPTEGWDGVTPSRPLTCCRKESFILASKAWMSWYLSADDDGPSVLGAMASVGGPPMFPCQARVCASEVEGEGRSIEGPGVDKGRRISWED